MGYPNSVPKNPNRVVQHPDIHQRKGDIIRLEMKGRVIMGSGFYSHAIPLFQNMTGQFESSFKEAKDFWYRCEPGCDECA